MRKTAVGLGPAIAVLVAACGGQGFILGQTLGAGGGTSPAGSTTPSTQSAPGGTTTTPTTTPTTGGGGGGGGGTTTPGEDTTKSTCTTTADTFANFANAALQANCNGCHSGEWKTAAQASTKASSLRGQISGGLMPPGGNLDATVKSRLLTWLNCPTPLP